MNFCWLPARLPDIICNRPSWNTETECPLDNLLLQVVFLHYNNNNGTICTLLMKPLALPCRRRCVYVSASFNICLFGINLVTF